VTKAERVLRPHHKSRMSREGAPCHARSESPPKGAGVQSRRLRGDRLTWTRKGEGTSAWLESGGEQKTGMLWPCNA